MFLTSCAAQPSLTPDAGPPTRVGDTLCRVIEASALAGSAEHGPAETLEEVRLLGSIGLKVVGDSRDLCPTKPAHSLGLLGFREQ